MKSRSLFLLVILFVAAITGCDKKETTPKVEDLTSVPTVSTASVDSIEHNSATSGGMVIYDGGTMVTARGVCWSKNPHPATSDSTSAQGSGTGNYSCGMTGLSPKTKYYARAYATNAAGTAYGDTVSFTTKDTTTNYNMVKLFQWNGTPDNGYYQNFNYGYGVVYDLSTYPEVILKYLDFHHASWGSIGIWQ